MSLLTYDTTTGKGLFPTLGRIFGLMEKLNTDRGTTIPAYLTGAETAIRADTLVSGEDLENLEITLWPGMAAWQAGYSNYIEVLRQFARNYLIQVCMDEHADLQPTLADCLPYLVEQMEEGLTAGIPAMGTHVEAFTITTTVTADADNVGDIAVVVSTKRGNGRPQQNIFAETLTCEVADAGSIATADTDGVPPTLTITGQDAAPSIMDPEWPDGSQITRTLTVTDETNTLLDNSDFADAEDDNIPDGWVPIIGTLGTNIKLSPTPVQIITASCMASSTGTCAISWNDNTRTHWTPRLPAAMTAGDLQTALNAIPALSSVTVASSSGSVAGDVDFTVTMHNTPGKPATFGTTENSSGSMAVVSLTSGSSGALKGRCVELNKAAAIYRPVWLQPDVSYMLSVHASRCGDCSTGTLTLELVQDTSAYTAAVDTAGNSYSLVTPATCLAVAATSLPSQTALSLEMRVSKNMPQPCFVGIKFNTLAAATSMAVYANRPYVAMPLRLYDGGPYVAAFAGAKQSAVTDSYSIAATNNRTAPNFQDYFEKCFRLSALNLTLPTTVATTSDLAPNSLIIASSSLV